MFSIEEIEGELVAMNASSHIQWAFMKAKYVGFDGQIEGEGDLVMCSGVKRLPVLYTLLYWKVCATYARCMGIWGCWPGVSYCLCEIVVCRTCL